MAEKDKDGAGIDKVEVESLTDEDLESASGGGNYVGLSPTNNATTGCPISSNAANACC